MKTLLESWRLMKGWKPFIFENSKVPVWLSKVAPIEIGAISFFLFVFCRGSATKKLKTHETIHFQQQLEMLFVFQWLMYLIFWIIGCIKHRNGKEAYYRNPFEQEAYDNEHDIDYLKNRKRYSWWKYKV